MRENPLFREGIEIFYVEGHGLAIYFFMLIILAPIEFLSLYIPSLDVQMWTGSASLFKVCSTTVLLMMVYFAMRVANQEFAPWRFQPAKHWLRDEKLSVSSVSMGQLALLLLHLLISVLLCAPFLIWAGAIARTRPGAILVTFFLLLFYSLSYSVWGLVTLALWERKPESRQVLVRCVFFAMAIVSALIYLPLNPVAYLLSYLGQQELKPLIVGSWKWSPTMVHFSFHLLLLTLGLAAWRWVLKREAAV
jgi:hypothetical protein